jgi:hypothetical protein
MWTKCLFKLISKGSNDAQDEEQQSGREAVSENGQGKNTM